MKREQCPRWGSNPQARTQPRIHTGTRTQSGRVYQFHHEGVCRPAALRRRAGMSGIGGSGLVLQSFGRSRLFISCLTALLD